MPSAVFDVPVIDETERVLGPTATLDAIALPPRPTLTPLTLSVVPLKVSDELLINELVLSAHITPYCVKAEELPVPPLVAGSTPVTPVVNGKPVALVNVAEAGVPSAVMFPDGSN